MFLLIPNKASSSVPRVYLIIAEPENREQKTFRSWPLAVNASEIRCAFSAWEVELADKEGEKQRHRYSEKGNPLVGNILVASLTSTTTTTTMDGTCSTEGESNKLIA